MQRTNLEHLETEAEIQKALNENENIMICCGKMGPMCIPVYKIMEGLEKDYPHVAFRDIEFDIPAAFCIRNLSECSNFMGLPFTVYFKNGKVVAATTSIQSKNQIIKILDKEFGKAT